MKLSVKVIVICWFLFIPVFGGQITDNHTIELTKAHLHKILEKKGDVTFTVTMIGKNDIKLQQIPDPGKFLLNNKEDMFLHEGKLVIVGQHWMAVEN